ncbi:hypothetical protein [Prochlorococcus marinus]|uniref:Uncharacterized protein n=1 Tax=Prochlorococcus marinus (strain MIT 9211) TaxID=93059 RepID=A9B9D6_PROM4|nr:hypothetical protein [Prochlorococcus marinus]ABX07973.1 Hypothetical protein P9211_00421 [Prochlorococcus marinus str. MIT 9211]
MPASILDNLRLMLMQEVLPVGMALFKRVRQGGANKVAEAFSSSLDPLQELKTEGHSAAKSLREQLDQISPGLGNPVMEVEILVDDHNVEDDSVLIPVLKRIEDRLDLLKLYLSDE